MNPISDLSLLLPCRPVDPQFLFLHKLGGILMSKGRWIAKSQNMILKYDQYLIAKFINFRDRDCEIALNITQSLGRAAV